MDRAVAHLRENLATTSDLGRLFRATGHVRLGVDEADPAPALDKLAGIRELRDRLGDGADHAALAARRLGASWGQIGDALRIGRQAAQQNWGNVGRAPAGRASSRHERREPHRHRLAWGGRRRRAPTPGALPPVLAELDALPSGPGRPGREPS